MFRPAQLQEMVSWCSDAEDLAGERQAARTQFFAEDNPRPVSYWPGVDDRKSKERRFLGWFMIDYRLPGGERPGTLAAENLFQGRHLEEALAAVEGARYVLCIVTGVVGNRRVFLEIEDERFVVDSKSLSFVQRDTAVATYLLPARSRLWLPGPGWLEWPVFIIPKMRTNLKQMQPRAISVERMLENRAGPDDKPGSRS